MRKVVFTILGGIVLTCQAGRLSPEYVAQARSGALARIVLSIRDDDGCAVSNASVKAYFSRITRTDPVDANTDGNGVCVLEHRTCGNSIEYHVEKGGHYPSKGKTCLIRMGEEHAIVDGKWQPCPMESRLVLRGIRHPRRLVDFGDVLEVPVTNRWFGFDMAERRLAKPHGEGRHADVEFLVDWDGLPPARSRFCRLLVRFPGELSGGYYSQLVPESSFPYCYSARPSFPSLDSKLEIVDRNGDPHETKIPFRAGSEFVFRTRCVQDVEGRLQSAHYGSIRMLKVGPGWNGCAALRLVYVLNPEPNDSNLEPLADTRP